MRQYIYTIYLFILVSTGLFSQNNSNEKMPPPPPPPIIAGEHAEFPGGYEALSNFIYSNLKYPDLVKQKKELDLCHVRFTVDIDGSIKNILILDGVEGCVECDKEAKRLISSMPKWKPATKNGSPMSVNVDLPIDFSVEWNKQTQTFSSEKEEIFTVVEEMPQYPGGQSEEMSFIQSNLIFPESAVKNKTFGKCFVKFIVRKDGKITDVMVLRGVPNCPECDEEAKKVLTKMPAWMPGKQNGRAVNVYYTRPINFQPR